MRTRGMVFALSAGIAGMFWMSASAGAQVVAKQGERAAGENSSAYHSPMILELPVAGLLRLAEDSGKEIRGTGEFICDDAALSRLLIVKRKPKRGGGANFELQGAVTVRPSWDRLVKLRFELMVGADLAAAEVQDLEAEEGRISPFTSRLPLDAKALERLTRDEESALLRLTMSVEDDD